MYSFFHYVCCYFFHLMLLYDGIKDFPLIVYFSGKMTISAKLCCFNFPFLAFYESCLFVVFQFCNNGSGAFIGVVTKSVNMMLFAVSEGF